MGSIPENAMDFCKKNRLDVQDENADEKARVFIVSKIKELLELADKICKFQAYKPSGLLAFVDKIRYNPEKAKRLLDEFNSLLKNTSPEILLETVLRLQLVSQAYYDADLGPRPMFLNTKKSISTKTDPEVLRLIEELQQSVKQGKENEDTKGQ